MSRLTKSFALFLLFAGLLCSASGVLAATYVSRATGNWGATGTWSELRTGTITTSTVSTAVTGVGTTFTTQLAAGNVLYRADGVAIGTVSTITNNTALTLTANAVSTNSGIPYYRGATATPIAGDTVTVNSPNTVTVSANAAATTLTINSGGTLTVGAFTIAISGATTISGLLSITSTTGTKTFTGNVTINNGGTLSETVAELITYGGNLTINSGGTLTEFGAATMSLAGTTFTNDGTYNPSTGLHTFSNASPTITGASAISFGGAVTGTNALTINKSAGAVSVAGTLTVGATGLTLTAGTLNLVTTTNVTGPTSITGTLNLTTNTTTRTFTGAVTINNGGSIVAAVATPLVFGNNLTINTGGTLTEFGAATMTCAGSLQNDGTYTASTGVHTFSGAAKTFSGATAIVIPRVAVTGTYTNSGTLTVGTALSGAGSLTNTATLNIGGTSSITTLTNQGTATITGAGAISTALANFTNSGTLNLNGTGTITGITNSGTINLATSGTITALTNNAAGTLNISTTPTVPTITTLTATAVGNTVNYSGAGNQTVKATTYSNLGLSGSGAKAMGATTINGNFTMSGTATTAPTGALTVGGNFTIGTGTTFTAGNFNHTVSGNFDATGTFTSTGSTVTLNGATAQTISGANPVAFNNLAVSAVNPNITLATNVTVVTVTTGTVTLTSTCPTDYTLTSTTPAQVLHSCPSPPTVTTNAATALTTSGATLNGTVSSNWAITTVTFDYGLTAGYGSSATATQSPLAANAVNTAVSAAVTGLACNTLYHFRVTGVNSAGTTNGGDLTFTTSACPAVVINTYYPGTASVAAGATSITLGAATGVATPIAIGDMLLIIQMQDATIDITNTATYGTVSGTPTAGKYEYAIATSAVPLIGGTLTLCALTNAYTDAAYVVGSSGQKRFQVIRVPVYASYTINAITALAWNGSTGGVLAFDVTGALTLNSATVDVSGMGFRGGASRQLQGVVGGGTGLNTDYLTLASVNTNASKGEGIAGTPYYVFTAPSTLTNTTVEGYPNGSHARGAPANAGGGGTDGDPVVASPGGNDQNPGGGGGGNGGAGGIGGIAWCNTFNATVSPAYNCPNGLHPIDNFNSGGVGGKSLSTWLSASKLTLGGGGGGGSTNNGTGTPAAGLASSGAAGGGIIMIRTGSVTGSATFNANGSNANNTVLNDGSGGGGGGGAVMIFANSGSLATSTVNATGGIGGTNTGTGVPHGPGGGGGGGYVVTSSAVTSSVLGGASGVTQGTGVAPASYGAAAGTAGSSNSGLTASAIPGVALGATSCSSVAHFAINIGVATASTCTPKSITITAQDALNVTVTNYTGTVNITTSPAHGDWAKVTAAGTLTPGSADSGAASYQFVLADSGVITLALTDQHADASLTVTVADSVVPATSSTSAAISYSGNAFVITNDTVQVAGRPQAMSVQMSCSGSTATYYTGTKNLKAWYTRDPDDPAGTAPSITGMTSPPLGTTVPGANNLTTLTFNASGLANFNLTTVDVGKYAINLRDDSLSFVNAVINGSSNTITTRPFALVVSGIKQGATNNLGGTAIAGSKFIAAADTFQATVGAYLWNSAADTTPADGIPDATATLAQTTGAGAAPAYRWLTTLSVGTPITPATGTTGSLSNGAQTGACPTGSPNCFTSGVATPTNLSYDEVGSFTLSGSATNFLNSAGVNLTALVFDNSGTPVLNGVVGRFYPDHFTLLAGSTITPACGGAAGFTYMGQPGLGYSFTIEARNKSDARTKNYRNNPDYATGTVTMLAENSNNGIDLSSRLPAPTGSWTAVDLWGGQYAFAPTTATFSRLTSPDGPFDSLQIGVKVTDADGPVLASLDMNPATSTNCTGLANCTGKSIGGATTIVRFGRLRLLNAYGSELLDIRLPVRAEYSTGPNSWSPNSLDNCTILPSSSIALGNYLPPPAGTAVSATNMGVAPTDHRPGSNTTLVGGSGTIVLAKPSPVASGSFDVVLNLGTGIVSPNSCVTTGTFGGGTAASLGYLLGNWCGSNHDRAPSARVKLGSPKAPYIYLRERY